MQRSFQHQQIVRGSSEWLAALIDSFEDVARAGHDASCDPYLVIAVSDYLARPVSQKFTAEHLPTQTTRTEPTETETAPAEPTLA